MAQNPYQQLGPHQFWRTGVVQPGVEAYPTFWSSKWELPENAQFATFGSCFAQHISRELRERKMGWINAEPAPGRSPEALALRFNYGVFSARTGNIYTLRQLLQWLDLALDPDHCAGIETWMQEEEGRPRYYDSLRPGVEPGGFASAAEALASRIGTARAFGNSIRAADVFVFTMGLTEGWENRDTGQVYPMCPGTLAGQFDPDLHLFKNYSYPEIAADFNIALKLLKALNPNIRVLLTVSPVPLTATATEAHVLLATTYSKSVLRAVAGDMAQTHPEVDYFPSFEVISGTPSGGAFYEDNLRSVRRDGVDIVMSYFFGGLNLGGAAVLRDDSTAARISARQADEAADDLICEEMALEQSNDN